MKLANVLMATAIVATAGFTSCKPKDADIKSAIEKKISATPEMAGTTVDVKDGVATLSGNCKDDACKQMCEKEVTTIKGVKSVVNNCTVTPPPPPPAPVVINVDEQLIKAVADAVKDFPTVKTAVKEGVITLTGTIKKEGLQKLMPALQSLKPKKVENQLTIQ
jgi:hypothetical protein